MYDPPKKIIRTAGGFCYDARCIAAEEGDFVYTLAGVTKRVETLVKPVVVVGLTFDSLQADRLQKIPVIATVLHIYTDRGVTRCVIEEKWIDPATMDERKTVIVQTVSAVNYRLRPVATSYELKEVPL